MKGKRVVCVFLTVIGTAGAVLSFVMMIAAVRFGELGRVLLYFVTTAVCTEFAVFIALKLRK